MQSVDSFLKAFLAPPPGDSPQDIKARLLHWIAVANEPHKFLTENNPHSVAAKRRSARQNLRRLAQRHPEIADQLMKERNQGVA